MGRRNILIAGNWKMNGLKAEALSFVDALRKLEPPRPQGPGLLICPPATLIALMAEPLAALGVPIGGQDCHADKKGAYTGDVSAPMLRDLGATHVIVGHSERRTLHGETDLVVQAKAHAATEAGLTPIICVGEHWAEREVGEAERVVRAQVAGSVPDGQAGSRLVIAYEPVWAIGSGRTPTLGDIDAMHHIIREAVAQKTDRPEEVLVLYGGSVKPANAKEILAMSSVGGALVGGASLDAGDFIAIASAAPA
jgi:triosephosphate isomerase (TIM)